MDSSELLRQQLAKQIDCARNGVAIGPTGPTGPAGDSGLPKVFTIFIKYKTIAAPPPGTGTLTVIERLYIPPGLSIATPLVAGGVFTADEGSDLVFFETTNITITNTKYAFPIGLSATGYGASAYWFPTASSSLGGNLLRWQNTQDNTLNLTGVTAQRLNGGYTGPTPTTGVTAGWHATLTIYYL